LPEGTETSYERAPQPVAPTEQGERVATDEGGGHEERSEPDPPPADLVEEPRGHVADRQMGGEGADSDADGPRAEVAEGAPPPTPAGPEVLAPDSGAEAAAANDRVDSAFSMSDAERDLGAREATRYEPLKPGEHVSEAYRTEFRDGSAGVYKPMAGEDSPRSSVPEGELWNREIAVSRLDEALGFDLVPTTTEWTGPDGIGSMQEFEDNATNGLAPDAYTDAERERMAVLDYVSGNTDRHWGNYLTGADGRLVAIDHGLSLPESDADPIRSDFVCDQLNRPLSDDLVNQMRAVDERRFTDTLRASGLSESAIDGARGRLAEVRIRGAITGEAWSGRIVDAGWGVVREANR
jgi:hypothetical protein